MNSTRKLLLVPLVLGLFLSGCRTVPITGRSQFLLLSEGYEIEMGAEAYAEILGKFRIVREPYLNAVVEKVGRRISAATGREEYDWEFRILDSKLKNAFCLPGGKVAVYRGILKLCKNEAGLATVMAHEAAHAIARHGGERMSQRLGLTVLLLALNIGIRESPDDERLGWNVAFGLVTTLGVVLPYSRAHEDEADHIGLIYMARAGYDPREAVAFWERFAKAGTGATLTFLSTHPSGDSRIAHLKKLMPQAVEEYRKARHQYGSGEALPLAEPGAETPGME